MLTLSTVGRTWPVEEFRAYLRALMNAANIADYAELSRLTGVREQQFSTWNRGTAQPSRESLAKIAPVLDVPPVKLWFQAGLATLEELDLADEPDLRVLPREFLNMIELWERDGLNDDQRKFLRRSAAAATAAVESELSSDRVRPTGRRRAS